MKHDVDGGARHISDWSQWTVEHMWQVLRNEDPERTARHSGAWYDVMDACARHRDRLRAFRDQLVQRWSGPAADAYLAKLDQLIGGLDETTEAAFNTYRALSTMADAVTAARQQMAPLYGQWQRYEQEERDARDQWWLVQAIRGNPVTPDEREALNRPARAIMNTASDAIFQSYLTMTPAPPYDWPGGMGDAMTPLPDSTGQGLNPPKVSPVPRQMPLPLAPTVDSTGPVLGGRASSSPYVPGVPPADNSPINGSQGLPPSGSDVSHAVAPSVGGFPGLIGPPEASAVRTLPGAGNGTASPARAAAIPPAVIGARPGASGWAPIPATGAASGGVRRPTPVGGVMRPFEDSRTRRRSGEGQYRDDEVQFAVDTSAAVSGVLEPGPEPSFTDPGPAIGLPR